MGLDIGINAVLAEVLLDARSESQRNPVPLPEQEPIAQREGTPWYIWAGVGLLAAGATGVAFSLQGDAPSSGGGTTSTTTTSSTGTVVVRSP